MPDGQWRFVQEVAALSGVRDQAVLHAFDAVPREDFLPPGPWTVEGIDGSCFQSPDADPSHVLHAVGVVLSRAGEMPLHCANPAAVARSLAATSIAPGDRVLHIGAGLGYYSAVIAELTGPSGQVIAAEIDPNLAAQARRNLAPWAWVSVVGDALALPPQSYDVIFSSAGMASIPPLWLELLPAGARMTLPLTGGNGAGFSFSFRRKGGGGPISAKMESLVRFYPCLGLRKPADVAALDLALGGGQAPFVSRLRLDFHERDQACWLHGDGWCLSL